MNTEEVIYTDNILLAWSEKGHHRHGNTGNSTCRVTGRSFLGVSSWILTSHQLHRITSGWYVIKKRKEKKAMWWEKDIQTQFTFIKLPDKRTSRNMRMITNMPIWLWAWQNINTFHNCSNGFQEHQVYDTNWSALLVQEETWSNNSGASSGDGSVQHEDQYLWSKYHESDSALHKHPPTKAATGPCFCIYFCPYMYIMVTIT